MASKLQQLTIFLYQDSLEATLKQMPPPMKAVDTLSIDAIQLPHPFRQIGLRCFDQQAIAIAHQAIGMTDPSEAPAHFAQYVQERAPVILAEKDNAALVSLRRDRVHNAWVFIPQGSGQRTYPVRVQSASGTITVQRVSNRRPGPVLPEGEPATAVFRVDSREMGGLCFLCSGIDHRLAAPNVRRPVKLMQPRALFKVEDPEFEARSAGHKIRMGMGNENAARVKAKLRELRAELTRNVPKR